MLCKKQFHRKLTPFDIPLRLKRFSTGGIVEVRKRGGGSQGGGGLPNQRLRCIPLATSKSRDLVIKELCSIQFEVVVSVKGCLTQAAWTLSLETFDL